MKNVSAAKFVPDPSSLRGDRLTGCFPIDHTYVADAGRKLRAVMIFVDFPNAKASDLHGRYGSFDYYYDALAVEGLEFYTKSSVGIGTVVKSLKDLSLSFKEAQVALEVGKVFDTDKNIISYNNLGIGRLIYQLPVTLCEMFLNEVFKRETIDSLDYETLYTIQKFFENNLNVSETSRKLFVHRNTLVYRLEKIRRITGLDLRQFDHAIVFKVALMVKKYLESDVVKY